MTAGLPFSSTQQHFDDSDLSPSQRTPQRSSSLSHKGQHHHHAAGYTGSSNNSRQKKRSPLLQQQHSRDNDGLPYDDDDEIPLHTRPASFAAPPSASSRYNHHVHSHNLAAMMDASLNGSSSTTGPGSTFYNTRSNPSSSASAERQDPTPSTSRLPYDSGTTSQQNNVTNYSHSHPHSANPLSSNQYSHYTNNNASQSRLSQFPSSSTSQYQQEQQQQPLGSSLLATTRSRQDSNGSSGSSSNSRFMQSNNGMLQSQMPRRSRSVENNSEASLPLSSTSASSSSAQQNQQQQPQQHQRSSDSSRTQGGTSSSMTNTRGKSGSDNGNQQQQQPTNHKRTSQLCAKCNQPMTGQFVRALGTVFHLDCFRCQVSLPLFLLFPTCFSSLSSISSLSSVCHCTYRTAIRLLRRNFFLSMDQMENNIHCARRIILED